MYYEATELFCCACNILWSPMARKGEGGHVSNCTFCESSKEETPEILSDADRRYTTLFELFPGATL